MQVSWTSKDKRQFRHIKLESLKAGKREEAASKIAARVVNKQRRLEGWTDNKSTMGTGNPNTRLEERTYRELYNLAREQEITGRSRLNKIELVDAIREKR